MSCQNTQLSDNLEHLQSAANGLSHYIWNRSWFVWTIFSQAGEKSM